MVEIVERWNPYAKIRQDLFAFIDILAIRENDTLAVQTTSGGNVSARVSKIKQTPGAAAWLSSPTRRVEVHGWAKKGAAGKRKLWECRTVHVRKEDLTASNP